MYAYILQMYLEIFFDGSCGRLEWWRLDQNRTCRFSFSCSWSGRFATSTSATSNSTTRWTTFSRTFTCMWWPCFCTSRCFTTSLSLFRSIPGIIVVLIVGRRLRFVQRINFIQIHLIVEPFARQFFFQILTIFAVGCVTGAATQRWTFLQKRCTAIKIGINIVSDRFDSSRDYVITIAAIAGTRCRR